MNERPIIFALANPDPEITYEDAMDARPDAWTPDRDRTVTQALQAYAALTTSASRGAVRDLDQIR